MLSSIFASTRTKPMTAAGEYNLYVGEYLLKDVHALNA